MKRAFVTTLCDSYIDGFFITLYSLLASTEKFNYDIVIFEWGTLSDKNKVKIKKLYDNVIFKTVDTESYKNINFSSKIRNWNEFNPAYRFDIFTLKEYQKIIYFDCDILFEIDMNDMLHDDTITFGACKMEECKQYHQTINSDVFNAGLLVIDNIHLNDNTKRDLINISLNHPPVHTVDHDVAWIGNQPILNNYFYDKVIWIPEKYNLMTLRVSKNNFNTKNNYHFIGHKKPWMSIDKYDIFDKFILDVLLKREHNNHLLLFSLIKRIVMKYDNIKNKITETI